MSNYKCIRSFKSKNGKEYLYGDRIHSLVYHSLNAQERNNFILEDEETYGNSSFLSSHDNLDNFLSNASIWGSDQSSSDSTSSSDDGFGGFGGGSFGGGGASGSWDDSSSNYDSGSSSDSSSFD